MQARVRERSPALLRSSVGMHITAILSNAALGGGSPQRRASMAVHAVAIGNDDLIAELPRGVERYTLVVQSSQHVTSGQYQTGVHGQGSQVPGVRKAGQQWDGFHGPVEAQGAREEQQHGVSSRQVVECEGAGQQAVRVGCWIVRGRELWRLVSHEIHTKPDQRAATHEQTKQAFSQSIVATLEQDNCSDQLFDEWRSI